MKPAGFFLLALLFLPAWGDDDTSKRLIDVGTTKVAVFEETVSSDGRYAIGWSIRPHTKNAKPVDWSLWDPNDASKLTNVCTYLPGEISDDDDYELYDCVIDLKAKKILELASADPEYTGKNRGFLAVAWSPAGKGTRYALFENDFRFSNVNLWLITIDSSGMHQKDLAADLNKATAHIVAEKRPLTHQTYQTIYSVATGGVASIPPVAFHDSTVILPFESDIPKSGEDFTEVDGLITIKLADGSIIKAISNTPRDDPFQDIPAMAKADHQLNQIYGQLSQKIPSDQRADLKKDQLAWIDQRDADAAKAMDESAGDPSAHDIRDARNKSLLESTQKRAKELQDRLNALH
jgi:hypothetical protein